MTTHEPDHPGPRLASMRDWLSRNLTAPLLAVSVLALALLALSAGALWLLRHEHPVSVLAEEPAGRVLRVQLHGDFFSHSLVETENGYYALSGAMSLNKGEPVSVQELHGGQRRLCDSLHRCTQLMRPWF